MAYGLSCTHIVYVATEMGKCLPLQTFNSCWNVESKGMGINSYQIEEPSNNSIMEKMQLKKEKRMTREQ